MAVTINSPVHFRYIATGDTIPSSLERDNNTIYFIEQDKQIAVGNEVIANQSTLPENILTIDNQVLTSTQLEMIKRKLQIQDYTGPVWETGQS